jgi:hypothetical protein
MRHARLAEEALEDLRHLFLAGACDRRRRPRPRRPSCARACDLADDRLDVDDGGPARSTRREKSGRFTSGGEFTVGETACATAACTVAGGVEAPAVSCICA